MNVDGAVAGERYEDRFLTVRDGLKLHYRDYPGSSDRPPILCLHGLTRNSRDFAEFAERFSPRFRVLALRSEEHTSELQSLIRISYAVFCFKQKHMNTHN